MQAANGSSKAKFRPSFFTGCRACLKAVSRSRPPTRPSCPKENWRGGKSKRVCQAKRIAGKTNRHGKLHTATNKTDEVKSRAERELRTAGAHRMNCWPKKETDVDDILLEVRKASE